VQTIIDVEKVFSREVNTANGVKKVYDARTTDGNKYSAWEEVGAAIEAAAPGKLTVEYEERPKNGYPNYTIKKLISAEAGANGSTNTSLAPKVAKNYRSEASPDEQARMSRAVAFKGAIDLFTAGGNVTGTLEDVVAVAELTQGLLDVVEGTFKVSDGFIDLETS
jgi:hypothetical protein